MSDRLTLMSDSITLTREGLIRKVYAALDELEREPDLTVCIALPERIKDEVVRRVVKQMYPPPEFS